MQDESNFKNNCIAIISLLRWSVTELRECKDTFRIDNVEGRKRRLNFEADWILYKFRKIRKKVNSSRC